MIDDSSGAVRLAHDDLTPSPVSPSSLAARRRFALLAARSVPGAYDEPLGPGDVIDRFTITRLLGAGGMGVVYAASDPKLGREVAIKVVSPRPGRGSTAEMRRLVGEAEALARIQHRNVVTIHDRGIHEGKLWIAMELISGSTLRSWAEAAERRWPDTLRALLDVAHGVAEAHRAGLVHRDLKPDNVMIDPTGWVRVMDFGLARAHGPTSAPLAAMPTLSSLPNITTPPSTVGTLAGTVFYMAPEQWRGRGVGPPADQFAWCVMAWELLYRERPFAGDSDEALRAAVLHGERRRPPRRRRVPRWLRRILERGLAVDPSRRWGTMEALILAITNAQRRARRQRATLVVLASLGAFALGVSAWSDLSQARIQADARAAEVRVDERELAGVWDAASIAVVRAGFLSAATPGDTFTEETWRRVHTLLDHYVYSLRAAYLAIDRASPSSQSPRECLHERREELRAFLHELTLPGPLTALRAVESATKLTPVDTCRRTTLPPIADLRNAVRLRNIKAQRQVGRYTEALAGAEDLLVDAKAGTDKTLEVEAMSTRGITLRDLGRFSEADDALWGALLLAIKLHDDARAGEIGLQWLEVVGGDLMRTNDAERHRPLVAEYLAHGDPSPLQRARLRRIEAMLQSHLGAYNDAAALLRGILEEFDPLGPEAEGERIEALILLADVLRRAGDSPAAAPYCEEAHMRWNAHYGEGHPGVARFYLVRAQIMMGYLRGDLLFPDDAVSSQLHRALALAEAGGLDHLVGAAYNDLANTQHYCQRANPDACRQSLELADRAVDAWMRAYGTSHPRVAIALGNRAALAWEAGDKTAAFADLERATRILAVTTGPLHPTYAYWQVQLARFETLEGRFDAAIPRFEEALQTLTHRTGLGYLAGQTSHLLGTAYWRAKRYADANAACRESVAQLRVFDRERAVYSLAPLLCLGRIHVSLGEDARGEVVLGEAIEHWAAFFDSRVRQRGVELDEVGDEAKLWRAAALHRLGRHAEADSLRREAVAAYRSAGDLGEALLRDAQALARDHGVDL